VKFPRAESVTADHSPAAVTAGVHLAEAAARFVVAAQRREPTAALGRFAGKVNASFDRLMIRYQEVTSGTQPRIGVTDSSQLAGPVKRRTDAAQNDSECRIIRNCYGRPLGVKTIAPVESTELLHFHGEPGGRVPQHISCSASPCIAIALLESRESGGTL
jgi:hypothetical protein